jgi:VIT1/CCC1 family predicted Fe2+/Mn2+ transporter
VHNVAVTVAITTLLALLALGAMAARAGGASMVKGAARVAFWGALAMSITAALGGAIGVLF